jgi:putative DNA primase/helicase
MDSEVFKQLVSGETFGVRLPYLKPYEMWEYAKLMFNANELPANIDNSDAYYRRLLILVFRKTIEEDRRDPELAKNIIATELSGIFNWVLEGLQRLIERKKFSYSKQVNDNTKEYRESSDTVISFLNDENYVPSARSEIPLKHLNDEYRIYCASSGYQRVKKNELSKALRRLNYSIERRNVGYCVGIQKRV